MAYTQDDLDAIKAAIASGAKRVRYSDGSEIEYQSLTDMLRAKATIDAEVNPPAVGVRAFVGSPRSGY